ncbi:MAG: RibD family protein [Candidatus Competibacteraceae bacterium]|jgi:riboflavin-specific deaminase-like protein|nr:RibD family protein [Candidatus Competibacteraceae bacterium]
MPAEAVSRIARMTPEQAWQVILLTRHLCKTQDQYSGRAVGLDTQGIPAQVLTEEAVLVYEQQTWRLCDALNPTLQALFELYLPQLNVTSQQPYTIGHLGQSLDGHIATESGQSGQLNGPENILHLHRLRALCDVIIVGAGTVAADNPQLTTRLVPGDNPVRVVIDPALRLRDDYRIFTDGVAETLVVCAEDSVTSRTTHGQATVVKVPTCGRRLELSSVLAALRDRGLHLLFVEGGGVTVSDFLQAGLLDCLQITVAPLVIGSGRPGIRLPSVTTLSDGIRPHVRVFRMGQDMLFDCDLSAAAALPPAAGLARIL